MLTKAPDRTESLDDSDSFITLKQAAALVGKTPSNISYLIQYGRVRKYNSRGEPVEKASNGELRVSKPELLAYIEERNSHIQRRMKALSISDLSLAFFDIPERERTKHVHRLHPYLGKFIPQLVEYFLERYFKPQQTVIDPFCGSGTTLVQACEMGINSIGIDISEFNVLISKVKIAEYDLRLMEQEVIDVMKRTVGFFQRKDSTLLEESVSLTTDSDYLKTWFDGRSLKEMLFYKSLIPRYKYQDLLKVILSRTIRSCRLIYHYELATPSRPVREPYICYKHNGKICKPVTTIIPRLRYYSVDTVRRINQFSMLRKPCEAAVLEADSRKIKLDQEPSLSWLETNKIGGIFTSPPYVGQIDYHEQHQYAYELFGFKRRDALEIGSKSHGKGERARKDYVTGISDVFLNIIQSIPSGAPWFVVANDGLTLYPKIFERAGLSIEKTFHRPVEDRTERDKRPYSESVFLVKSD